MNTKEIIYIDLSSGSFFLKDWQYYFAELVATANHDWVDSDDCPVSIVDGILYLHDANDCEIQEAARPLNEILLMTKLISDFKEQAGHSLPDQNYIKIGRIIADKLREIKQIQNAESECQVSSLTKGKSDKVSQIIPEEVHSLKSGMDWIQCSHNSPAKEYLWPNLWRENEICLLFADSNVGKSVFACQMAFEIAKSRPVIYFDYELDSTEFAARYAGTPECPSPVPDNFFRCEPDRSVFLLPDVENLIFSDIEKIVANQNAKVIIIDNLTYILTNASSSLSASVLMYNLKQLSQKYGLSILVIAHASKRNLRKPISQNDLAANKKLFNFSDSCFALARSIRDSSIVYLKQLKARADKISYGADNVMLMEMNGSGNWLHFDTVGFDLESNHHLETKSQELQRLKSQIQSLSSQGLTQREIAKILCISSTKVNKLINAPEPDIEPQVPEPATPCPIKSGMERKASGLRLPSDHVPNEDQPQSKSEQKFSNRDKILQNVTLSFSKTKRNFKKKNKSKINRNKG